LAKACPFFAFHVLPLVSTYRQNMSSYVCSVDLSAFSFDEIDVILQIERLTPDTYRVTVLL